MVNWKLFGRIKKVGIDWKGKTLIWKLLNKHLYTEIEINAREKQNLLSLTNALLKFKLRIN